jgi:hypothetical protein
MLPGIRAVIAAVATAVGLLMISFGMVATFRVAQDLRAGVLQADLAQRGRSPAPSDAGPRAIPIIAAPEPPPARPEYAEALEAAPVTPVLAAPPLAEPVPITPVLIAAPLAEPAPPGPRAEPPMGGPLPEQIAAIQVEAPPRDLATERAAKKKAAQKARAARLARERKATARRAAQIRARRKAAASSNNVFGDPFGASFGTDTFGQRN